MITEDSKEYVLGAKVTEAAKGRKQSASVVLSVRLSTEELVRLESLSESTGKTVAQIVREAISNYRTPAGEGRHKMMFSMANGTSVAFGHEQQDSRVVRSHFQEIPA